MTNLSLLDPLSNQMNRFLQNFGLRQMPMLLDEERRLEMKVDLSEDEKSYIVRADIPGVKKEDISVDLDGNLVSISAEVKSVKEERKENVIHSERYAGKVFRSFTLASNVDSAKAEAKYESGVLELKLPKINNGTAKRITIN